MYIFSFKLNILELTLSICHVYHGKRQMTNVDNIQATNLFNCRRALDSRLNRSIKTKLFLILYPVEELIGNRTRTLPSSLASPYLASGSIMTVWITFAKRPKVVDKNELKFLFFSKFYYELSKLFLLNEAQRTREITSLIQNSSFKSPNHNWLFPKETNHKDNYHLPTNAPRNDAVGVRRWLLSQLNTLCRALTSVLRTFIRNRNTVFFRIKFKKKFGNKF